MKKCSLCDLLIGNKFTYCCGCKKTTEKNRNKAYYSNSKASIKEAQKSYNSKNKEKIKDIRDKWMLKNRDHYLAYHKEYYKKYSKTENGRNKIAASTRKRRAVKNNSSGFFDWGVCLSLYNSECAWCHSKSDLQADHIWPLTVGGSNWQFNIQPLCFKCNRKKSNKTKDVYQHYICL